MLKVHKEHFQRFKDGKEYDDVQINLYGQSFYFKEERLVGLYDEQNRCWLDDKTAERTW